VSYGEEGVRPNPAVEGGFVLGCYVQGGGGYVQTPVRSLWPCQVLYRHSSVNCKRVYLLPPRRDINDSDCVFSDRRTLGHHSNFTVIIIVIALTDTQQ